MIMVFLSETDGEHGAAPHAHPEQDRSQKGHQSVGTSHRRKGCCAEIFSYDQRVHHIVELLQHIAADHRERETEHVFCDWSF